MKQSQLDEIIACLPKEKTCFYYHRDRYVLYLLGVHKINSLYYDLDIAEFLK